MRVWSLHPAHLDRIGLVAGWREGLLAQAALRRPEGGYGRHPQLERFRASTDPLAAIGAYLELLADEADARGYRFDRSRVVAPRTGDPALVDAQLVVTTGQLAYERTHLLAKLDARSPADAVRLRADPLRAHPSFVVVPGDVAAWERTHPRTARRRSRR
ncbi:pyrimidine dimer DNA glycosylase/endonuclease V [Cellulomonas persica]|uniref:Pyrimidine dimer DNA glycosylase /DNA-(Apurinic or apyrimidinic site) lyase n=1 Tax=Cellulomonas persica TaxID=76861 RepID=A0A510UV98_9CELL|nr:pyrimidine dimer DNA glycosylase/endonuclease V [Cellulomonas persica]GEK16735.1 pyrimidine dimer DNA glycosylase /DNA-(apurinic or apyrimidinic site) lyase [Cellulomonas persica]